MDIASIGIVLYSSFLLVSFSEGQHGKQQRDWTQHHCQKLVRACNSVPKSPTGPLRGEGGATDKMAQPGPPGPPGKPRPRQTRARGFTQPPRAFDVQSAQGERSHLRNSRLRGGEPGQIIGPRAGLNEGLPGGYSGRKENTGDRGLSGDSVSEWMDCSWMLNSNQGDGLLKECDFTKMKPHTSLHVVYEGSLQAGLCRRCCKRWYFTFNDVECRQPRTIDTVVSGKLKYGLPRYTDGRIEGLCSDALHSGLLRIALHLGNCQGISSHNEPASVNITSKGRITVREV